MQNINYNEIDKEMRGLIKALNDNGYATKFCCVGLNHDRKPYPYVIFDESLTDDKAMELFCKIRDTETLTSIDIVKWIRSNDDEVLINWKLEYGDFNSVPYKERVQIGAYNIIINDTNLIEEKLKNNSPSDLK